MSQYIQFYVKSNTGEMLPIGTYSRSTAIYQFGCDYVPSYSVVQPLTQDTLREIIEEIFIEKTKYQMGIEKLQVKVSTTCEMRGKIEEKQKAIEGYLDEIEELEGEQAAVVNAGQFYRFLLDIVDEAKSSRWNENERDRYDPDRYIYAGVECEKYEGEDE